MKLLLIRHGIAEPKVDEGGSQPDDTLRALTLKGRRRMKRGARGLRAAHRSIDLLATSPLVRARQTAELVAAAYGGLPLQTVGALAPDGGIGPTVEWLRSVETKGTVALVGHEPSLGQLASQLIAAGPGAVSFGKGGAALLGVPAGVPDGGCELLWLATPSQLRRLGRSG